MFPVIIQLGPIIVYSLWLFAGLAFLLGVFVFAKLSRMRRLNLNFIYKYSFSIFIFGLIGSRLFFVIKNYQFYFQDFSISSIANIFYIWDKGLSVLGAIIGISITLLIYAIKEKEQIAKWFDILTISIISALGIGHIGTFLDGAAYGRETNLPWGITFDNPSIKYAVPIHPTQIYAFLYSSIILTILFILYKKNIVEPGKIMLIGILSYLSMMFLEGFIRGDDVLIYFGLREEQWFALFGIIIAGGYLIYSYNKNRKKNLTKKQHGSTELSI